MRNTRAMIALYQQAAHVSSALSQRAEFKAISDELLSRDAAAECQSLEGDFQAQLADWEGWAKATSLDPQMLASWSRQFSAALTAMDAARDGASIARHDADFSLRAWQNEGIRAKNVQGHLSKLRAKFVMVQEEKMQKESLARLRANWYAQ
jgi:hypothetical protein